MAFLSLDHRRPVPVVLAAAAGVAIMAVHLVASLLGAPPLVTQTVYVLGMASAPVAILAGIRRNRPETVAAWRLIAAGVALSALGDFLYVLYPLLFGPLPDAQWVNVPYLLRFPLIATGLVVLIRRRTPGWDLPAFIDASILAIAVSLVSWVFVIDPVRRESDASLLLTLESVAFPAGDVLLLVIGLRLMLGGGFDLPSLRLFGGYLAVLCGADTWYTMRLLHHQYDFFWPLETAWIGAAVLLGLAGLHPSMRPLGDRAVTADPVASNGRLGILAGASLLAPLTLVIQQLRGDDLYVLLVSGCCAALFLLVVLRLAGLVRVQRHAAITDGLTGLHTRRYFTENLEAECARANRGQHEPVALILLDVDHFKKVNDTYGHSAGDRVLVEVANRLRTSVRSGDVVARYGGEEFMVLLPRTEPEDAWTVAERLRTEIAQTGVALSGTEVIAVTASFGVAAVPDPATTPDELVNLVDKLLYDSKEGGRNRVSALPERVAASV